MAQHDSGSHAAGEKRGSLLWLWLLLGAILLGLLIWGIVELLDDDDDLDEALPVTTEEPSAEPTEEPSAEPTEELDVVIVDPTVTVDETSTTTATATETETATDAAPLGPVLVGDVDVLAATPAELSALVGQQVTADSVEVVELVADEAFYVGPEVGSTVLVRLEEFAGDDAPESPFQIEEGGTVSVTGTLEEIDEELLSAMQLYNPAEELELGGYYIQASEVSGVG